MMKKLLLFVALFGLQFSIEAQVAKKVLVEHFTNTYCSVCASRNPGFYTNLNNHPSILHLSIHPNIPYPSCPLYQQNSASSNARKTYYSITSTPSLVINGFSIPTSNSYNSTSLFTPFTGQTSPISIRMEQQKYGTDSIKVRVIVKAESTHSLGGQELWVGLAEDTVFLAAQNGEPRHYDVFRHQLGLSSITLPTVVGDSLVYNYVASYNINWDFSRIFAFAMVQNSSNRSVNQVDFTNPSTHNLTTGIFQLLMPLTGVSVYPNPTNTQVTIELEQPQQTTVSLYNLTGQLLQQKSIFETSQFSLDGLVNGVYLLKLQDEAGRMKNVSLVVGK